MPISRFLESLLKSGNYEHYMERLVQAFNPQAVAGLMCRNTISIGWDERLYDCDFNQMLDLEVWFSALMVEAGLTPLQALQSATLNPARFLGQLNTLGTIEAGKLADLVILDASPLDDIRNVATGLTP